MPVAQFSGKVTYTAPGGSVVSKSMNVACPYDAAVLGTIDIPMGTMDNTVFALAFGSIASPTFLLVENKSGHDIAIRINGAMADEYQIANGSTQLIALPAAAAAVPISSMSVVTTTMTAADGTVDYIILGE
jgi:hypothetical protein